MEERGCGASMKRGRFFKLQIQLIKIALIFIFFVIYELVIWSFLGFIYSKLGINIGNYVWLDHLAIFILFLLIFMYELLPIKVSKLLIYISILLIILAPILSLF